jgi:hypothetical protein
MPNEEIVAGQQAAAEPAFSRIIKDMTIYYWQTCSEYMQSMDKHFKSTQPTAYGEFS